MQTYISYIPNYTIQNIFTSVDNRGTVINNKKRINKWPTNPVQFQRVHAYTHIMSSSYYLHC